MKKNMGSIDKSVRIIISLVFVILVLTKVIVGSFAVIMLILAGVFVLTSLFSICPLYLPFGINTGKKKD
jgi:hypothetical protein